MAVPTTVAAQSTVLSIRYGDETELGWSLVAEQDGRVVGRASTTTLSTVDLHCELEGDALDVLLRTVATDAAARSYRAIHYLTADGRPVVIPLGSPGP